MILQGYSYVVPNNNQGGWSVIKRGMQRASVHTETKADVIKIGRVISQRYESNLVAYG